jgi:multiple sugar transport system permease protein
MGPLIYLNTPEKYTVSLGLMMFRDQEGISNYGSMIAMSLVALVPVIAFFMAFQRYLIDGMATSGLKG